MNVGDTFSVPLDRWQHKLGDEFRIRWHDKYYVYVKAIDISNFEVTYQVEYLQDIE